MPDWVLVEAGKRVWPGSHKTLNYWRDCYDAGGPFRALCDTILQHEQPPVDPLLIEARKLVSLRYNTDTGMPEIEATLRGDDDHTTAMQNCLTALRRGMELAKVQP